LLTESQVFEDEVFPGTTSADHPAQEMPEKHDHDKHFIGTVRIEPVAMSFILRVYEVLASHTRYRSRVRELVRLMGPKGY
jgi:hypothetical protein